MLVRAISEVGSSFVHDLTISDGLHSGGAWINGGILHMIFSSLCLDLCATAHFFKHLRKLDLIIQFTDILYRSMSSIHLDSYNLDSVLSMTDNLELLKLASNGIVQNDVSFIPKSLARVEYRITEFTPTWRIWNIWYAKTF